MTDKRNRRQRVVAACILLCLPAWASAQAQARAKADADRQDSHVCVDVRIGTETTGYLDCINAELRDVVARQEGRQEATQMAVQGSMLTAPTQVGVFNETAVSERLGSAFGHSVYPQRPPAPVYPLLPPPRH